MLSNGKTKAAAFLIAFITVLIYLPALQNDFVNWDDQYYIYENPNIQSFDFKSLKWMFTAFHASNWHPLTWLSHTADYAIWGLNPMGHHLTSILIHGLNTFLVVILIIKLIEKSPHPPFDKGGKLFNSGDKLLNSPFEKGGYRGILAGAVTGLLFGLHPLHVESVAWVSERKDVLYALFYMLSILTYINYVSNPPVPPFSKGGWNKFPSLEKRGKGRFSNKVCFWVNDKLCRYRIGNYLICLLFFILSLLSKPMAVTLPVVLIILDIYPLGRLGFTKEGMSKPPSPLPSPLRAMAARGEGSNISPPLMGGDEGEGGLFTGPLKVLLEKIPFIMLSVVSSIITIKAQQAGGAITPFMPHVAGDRALIALRALAFYLYKMILPTRLVPFYPYPSDLSLFTMEYIGICMLLAGITVSGILMWKRHKVILTAWLYYGVTLLPVLGIIQVGGQAAADRYTYLPMLGPFLMFGAGVGWIFNKIDIWHISTNRKILFIIPLILILCSLSFLNIKQQHVWKDSISLWTAELNQYPDIHKAYDSRAEAYMRSGNYQKAVEDLKSSIKINPQYATSYCLLGMAYEKLGANLQAIESYNKAIELDPQFGLAHFNRKKAYQNALKIYLNDIRQNPRDTTAYINRGTLYALAKMYKEALEDFNTALTLNPRMLTVYFNRGLVFAYLKDYRKALNDFEIAIELNPADIQAYYYRGLAFEKLGENKKAHNDFQTAARLGYKEAQDYLASKGAGW